MHIERLQVFTIFCVEIFKMSGRVVGELFRHVFVVAEVDHDFRTVVHFLEQLTERENAMSD